LVVHECAGEFSGKFSRVEFSARWNVAKILIAAGAGLDYDQEKMNEPENEQRRYKWPWFVAAMVVLGIVLAVVWMFFAAKKVERERDFNSPLPNSAPVR
jgi:hypothetical protein